MYINIIRLQSTSLIALCTILFSFHYGFGAPTKGRLEDPVKVNAKTEAVINANYGKPSLISYVRTNFTKESMIPVFCPKIS